MTTSDLIASAYDEAHPDHEQSADNAELIDELARRLSKLDVWRQKMITAVDLIEDAAYSAQDWSGTHLGDSLDAAKSLATTNILPLAATETKMESETLVDGQSAAMPCSASLVWHPGPAQGGGGTAQEDAPNSDISWWWDGDLLLIVVDMVGGREISLVRVHADGDQIRFYDPNTSDDNFGYSPEDISWWAELTDECFPPEQPS